MPDPTTDFSIFDKVEIVTYEPAGEPALENVLAVRRPLTQSRMRNVERYIELQATDVVFHFEGSFFNWTVTAAGDTVVDSASVSYEVLFVERQTLNNILVVVCGPN